MVFSVVVYQMQSGADCWSGVADTTGVVWCTKHKPVGRGESDKRSRLVDWTDRRSTSDGSEADTKCQYRGQGAALLSPKLRLWGTIRFLCATAATAVAHLSHRNFVCPFVCLSIRLFVCQSKPVQATITKSSPTDAWKTLVLRSIKLFYKFERGHLDRGHSVRGGRENLLYPADTALAKRDTSSPSGEYE